MAVSVGGAAGSGSLTYTSNDAVASANALATQINAGLTSGALSAQTYASGLVAPEPASGSGGVVTFSSPTTGAVFIDGADQYVVDAANGPTSVQGGAAGGTFLGGSGLAGAARNITYTNITPTGTATDQIVITGGNNLIQTATFGTGNYNVQTGNGNDTVNILLGNSTVNAGTGSNQINVGSGSNMIFSEGYDTITGSSVGGGADTVNIGSGQTSINSGTSSFLVNDSSPNPLLVTLGSGTDTVNFGGAGAGTIKGVDSSASISGVGTVASTETGSGDTYTITGRANATITAGAGNESINGVGTSGTEVFAAGSGNDTLRAGQGLATLSGGVGLSAQAQLVSGGTASTTFSFVNGQSGGADTISGFKSTDILSFTGYGPNPQGTAFSTAAGTVITLGDGTTITIAGATPAATQFRVS